MASTTLFPCANTMATGLAMPSCQGESTSSSLRLLRYRPSGLSHHHVFLSLHPSSLTASSMFSGSLDRRSLLSPSPSSSSTSGDASSLSHCQRGGCGAVRMSFSGANSPYEANNSFEHDEFIEAHVIEAVRMVPARDHLYMTMADGSEVEVEHVNPSAGRLLYLSSMPTIFLRMADSTNLLLPIVVGDLAIGFLMKAFKKDGNARPNYYELMKELATSLHSEVKHVKITQRVGDTYYARIYLVKPGTSGLVSVDARPSDAINLAVRAQVPIFVSRAIVQNDAVRVAYDPAKHGPAQPQKFAMQAQLDRGMAGDDEMLEEIALIKSMQVAAQEERYSDAAKLRDELTALRQKIGSRAQLNKF